MAFQIKKLYLILFTLQIFIQIPAFSRTDLDLPPIKTFEYKDSNKQNIAKEVSEWVIKVIEESNLTAVVISRPGTPFTQVFDNTKMGHTGIIIKDSELNAWTVYNLFSNPDTKHRYVEIKRTSIYDFFYSQPSLTKDALILIPEKEIQENLLKGFISGKYKDLIAQTEKYNLISDAYDLKSTNCVEWVLLNLIAAKINDYNPTRLTQIIDTHLKIKPLKAGWLVKIALYFTPNVFFDEMPKDGNVKAVMVKDLYNADRLIIKKVFYKSNSDKL